MRRACIDIGSNTTRLLVADCHGDQLQEVHQERVFTKIGRSLRSDGSIAAEKIAEVAEVVGDQLGAARRLGAVEVLAVATASVRRCGNGEELVAAIRAGCGLEVEVLSGDEEARLAFVGAAQTLGHRPLGQLGVIDVGGGSSELVVGTPPDSVSWSASFEVGSGDLAEGWLRSDPPSSSELAGARQRLDAVLGGVTLPVPAAAVAVGGSAASLRRLAGPLLDQDAFTRTLDLLCAVRAEEVARRFALDFERVRLLPAGLLILEAASQLFGQALEVGRGGVREGLLLNAAAQDA